MAGLPSPLPSCTCGAHAFAVDGRLVLFFGGYARRWERCVLGELGDTAIGDWAEWRLVPPPGYRCSDGRVVGRGGTLHVFAGTGWYEVDVRGLP